MSDFIYDLECFPNFFSCYAVLDEREFIFEISEWVDQREELYDFLMGLKTFKHRMVGFNNADYDYMLIHEIINSYGLIGYSELYEKSQAYFRDGKTHQFNPHVIWENKHHIPQVDLFKIHHFDNRAKMTSLKMIEFNMRSDSIQDLPYDPTKALTYDQAREILSYNGHDTSETQKFKQYSQPMIDFRDKLSEKRERNFTNFNDTKIGETMITMELEKHGIPLKINGKTCQSRRSEVIISEILLPYLSFSNCEFLKIKETFDLSVVNETDGNGLLKIKGFFKGISCVIDELEFKFGAGGLHASRNRKIYKSNNSHVILDWDVKSYYPNLAIHNNFYPEHLTGLFCKIYSEIYDRRSQFTKEQIENAIYKLALNAVFGNSNAEFSIFHDPKYLLSTTINGQLLLCMLAEQLMLIPDLTMIQGNTDGLTFLCPKEYREHAKSLWNWWQDMTNLKLEEVEYSMMAIRDVNSYLAVKLDGKVKRIGAYAYELAIDNPNTRELAWHKNQSSVVIAKAAEAALVRGESISDFIKNHGDKMDFMIRTKVPRTSKLELRTKNMWGSECLNEVRQPLQNISRYYASIKGGSLIKTMPHTEAQLDKWENGDHYRHEDTGEYQVVTKGKKPKSGKFKPEPFPELNRIPPRDIGIAVGVLVSDCTSMKDFKPENIDYNYYIKEAKKLVTPLLIG